ncbi:YaaC family protein [Bacillus sp. T3]|uniref:YaaC family protein n=1 Tax=Bacillus sp. T3 TaxID=467262 RepID=UPI003995E761
MESIKYQDLSSYSLFFSASFSQSFLKKSYQQQNIDGAEQKSYQNCYPFIYYLEHGKIYYQQAELAPLVIQPILLFYGFVHLIKACILTKDPHYPETTSVLAHGVSSRKRKKQHYRFLEDDVKLQKTGLFPFMSEKLFHMKQLEGDKVIMEELLAHIPELSPLFLKLEGKKTFAKVNFEKNSFYLSNKILDTYHMTENRFQDFLTSKFQIPFLISSETDMIKVDMNIEHSIDNGTVVPFQFNIVENHYSFPLLKDKLFHLPEILIHYLLLYNLSMIARYETEWWSELIKMMPNNDYPFVQSFLNVTQKKGPFLIFEFLTNEGRGL